MVPQPRLGQSQVCIASYSTSSKIYQTKPLVNENEEEQHATLELGLERGTTVQSSRPRKPHGLESAGSVGLLHAWSAKVRSRTYVMVDRSFNWWA